MTRYQRPSGLVKDLEYSATWSGVGTLGLSEDAKGWRADVATRVGKEAQVGEEARVGEEAQVSEEAQVFAGEPAATSVMIVGMGRAVLGTGLEIPAMTSQ